MAERRRDEVARDLRGVVAALETFGAERAASVVREATTLLLDDEVRSNYLGYSRVEAELAQWRASRPTWGEEK